MEHAETDLPLKHTRPLVFFALNLQFGAAIGFMQIAVPFWLAADGLSLAQIGAISATAFLPHALKILWVPWIDILPNRKRWYLFCALGTAVLVGATSLIPNPAKHLTLLVVLLTAMQALTATASAASNALMATTTRDTDKGRASGYYMAGNVGGTAILGALALWLSSRVSPTVLGLIMSGIVVAAALTVLWVHERVSTQAVVRSLGAGLVRLKEIFADLWATAKSRVGFTGILICALPVGCGALTNLFSAMAPDYQASSDVVVFVNGPGMGITGGLGSLVGGFLADRMNRRLSYALAGGLTGLSALVMAMGPMNTTTYAWGTLLYSFANGIAFAAFAAMVLEMVSSGAAVATKYALFVAVSNQAISYTTALDGWGSTLGPGGARGTLLFDFGITMVGIVILAGIVLVVRRMKPVEPAPVAA
ncbi:MAG: MFS transporter [Myxococcota bacterium]|nr:MFS transporter [Myxococcota bacterium]